MNIKHAYRTILFAGRFTVRLRGDGGGPQRCQPDRQADELKIHP